MQKLHFVGFTPELDGLILTDRQGSASGSHVVPLDDRLLQLLGDAGRVRSAGKAAPPPTDSRATRSASRQGSALSPRELQDRLRGGWTVEEVAKEAGTDVAWVNRFAAPVRAEQAQVVNRARELVFDKSRLGPSALPLGPSVHRNLLERGLRLPDDELDTLWSAYQLSDGLWVVRLAYTSRGRPQRAEWIVDLATGRLQARDRLASQLGHVAKGASPPPAPAEAAAVTPVEPAGAAGKRRRRAAATASTLAGEAAPAGGAAPAARKRSPAKKAARGRKASSPSTGASARKATPARKAGAAKKAPAAAKAGAAKKAGPTKAAPKAAPKKARAARKAAPAKKAAAPAKKAAAKKAAAKKAVPAGRAAPATKGRAGAEPAGPGANQPRSRRSARTQEVPPSAPTARVPPTPQIAPGSKGAGKRASSTKKAPPAEKAPPAPATRPADEPEARRAASPDPPPAATEDGDTPPIPLPRATPDGPDRAEAALDEPTRVFALPGPAEDGGDDDGQVAPVDHDDVDHGTTRVRPRGEDRIFRREPAPSSPAASASRDRAGSGVVSSGDDAHPVHGPLPAPAPLPVPDRVREAISEPIGEPPADPPADPAFPAPPPSSPAPPPRWAAEPGAGEPTAPERSPVFRSGLTRAADTVPGDAADTDPGDAAATAVEALAALYPPPGRAEGEPKRRRRRLRRG